MKHYFYIKLFYRLLKLFIFSYYDFLRHSIFYLRDGRSFELDNLSNKTVILLTILFLLVYCGYYGCEKVCSLEMQVPLIELTLAYDFVCPVKSGFNCWLFVLEYGESQLNLWFV